MSGSSGGWVGEGGVEEDPDIPMNRGLETMKMNKVHFNLDTMVQNITLIHETGQLVLSSVFHGHIRQLEKKLKLLHSRNVTHKKARNNGKISGTARTEMVRTIGWKNNLCPC